MKKFNIYEFLKERPLSWSSYSSFLYDHEEWYQNYILGNKKPETEEMRFGKKLAQALEDGNCDIPDLVAKLPYKKEHPFAVMFGKIKMVGFADDFDDKAHTSINEVKTGKKPWDQKRVDEHGQLTLYCLFNYITNKIKPENMQIALHWIPTKDTGDFNIEFVKPIKVHSFMTRRTMADILQFGAKINRVVMEMQAYVLSKTLNGEVDTL